MEIDEVVEPCAGVGGVEELGSEGDELVGGGREEWESRGRETESYFVEGTETEGTDGGEVLGGEGRREDDLVCFEHACT